MSEGLYYQLERTGDTATLYLTGDVRHKDDVAWLTELCFSLPKSVRTLRLDLRATHASADAMEAIGVLLCEWRERRAGEFNLFFGAPYSSAAFPPHDRLRVQKALPHSYSGNEALTGMYL